MRKKSALKKATGGLVSIAFAFAAMTSTGMAADFPTRAVRIVVNTGPGGLIDVTTRLVAEKMGESLGQSVVVENRAGGDGLVGILAVKNSPADGYTLLASSATVTIQPAVKSAPGYDLEKDFSGIGPMLRAPYIVVEGAGEPDKSLTDFIARAKKDPKSMSYASAGVGTGTHLAAAKFLKQAGIDILHVPYKGNGPAMPDVMAGRVNMIFEAYNSGISKVKDGTLKALAVTSTERIASMPDVPTIAEQGVPGYNFYIYSGILAPSGTPPEVVSRLSDALETALKDPDLQQRFKEGGGEALIMEPAEFDAYLKKDLASMDTAIRELGIEKK